FSSRRRHTRLQGDWSSDVCSSDLRCPTAKRCVERRASTSSLQRAASRWTTVLRNRDAWSATGANPIVLVATVASKRGGARPPLEIGRASCRERVEISVGAVALKKK